MNGEEFVDKGTEQRLFDPTKNDLAIQEANFNDLFTFDIMSPNSIVKDYNLPTAFSIPRIFFDTFSK